MDKLFVKRPGTKVIGVVQAIFFIAAAGCFIYALSWDADYEGLRGTFLGITAGLIVLGLLAIPFKRVVKAAEYYISKIENEYDVREGTNNEQQITNSDL